MVGFTSDIDWAPEEVVLDMLSIFEQFEIKCTFFATHDSNAIKNCDRNLFEIGIHPNFNPSLLQGNGKPAEVLIEELLAIYPEALGVRSHSLTQSSPLLNLFTEKGMVYDSNQLMPYQHGMKAFKIWNNLIRIPFNWEDDLHFISNYRFNDPKVDISNNSLTVLNFHPLHVFLNTNVVETYDKAKYAYQDYNRLKKHINTSELGTRDLLISLLEKVNIENITNVKQIEIANELISE